MKTIACVTLVLLMFPALLIAQGTSVGSAELKIAQTGRFASMGEASIADEGTLSSAAVNPANLNRQKTAELLFSHVEWIQGVQSEFFVASLPYSFGTLAFSISNTNVNDIEIRDRPGPPLATFSARSAAFQASYATSAPNELSVGGAIKLLYEKIYADEASGLGFDVGFVYHFSLPGLMLGISATNLGSMSKFRNEGSDLPTRMNVGASYNLTESDFNFFFASRYAISSEKEGNHFNNGIEVSYRQTIAFRIGYQTGYDSRGFSAGLGFRYEFAKLDYAYVPFSFSLGNAHLFTIGFEL